MSSAGSLCMASVQCRHPTPQQHLVSTPNKSGRILRRDARACQASPMVHAPPHDAQQATERCHSLAVKRSAGLLPRVVVQHGQQAQVRARGALGRRLAHPADSPRCVGEPERLVCRAELAREEVLALAQRGQVGVLNHSVVAALADVPECPWLYCAVDPGRVDLHTPPRRSALLRLGTHEAQPRVACPVYTTSSLEACLRCTGAPWQSSRRTRRGCVCA